MKRDDGRDVELVDQRDVKASSLAGQWGWWEKQRADRTELLVEKWAARWDNPLLKQFVR